MCGIWKKVEKRQVRWSVRKLWFRYFEESDMGIRGKMICLIFPRNMVGIPES